MFTGGFDLAAAEAVCAGAPLERGAVLDVLASLADKSLLLVQHSPGATRYRLLETVRQYAAETLHDAGEQPVATSTLSATSSRTSGKTSLGEVPSSGPGVPAVRRCRPQGRPAAGADQGGPAPVTGRASLCGNGG